MRPTAGTATDDGEGDLDPRCAQALKVCGVGGEDQRDEHCKVIIGEVGRAIGAIADVAFEALAAIIASVRRP